MGLLRHTTANFYAGLKVINVRALLNNSHVATNKCTNVKNMFLFAQNMSQLRHVYHTMPGVTEHQ